MAARTWQYLLRRVYSTPRLVPSQTKFSVYKLNSIISPNRTSFDFNSFFKKYKFIRLLRLLQPSVSKYLSLNMNENIANTFFNPPKSVRGMKKLERGAFKQVVKIPAIKVPVQQVSTLNKLMKKSLCKFAKIRPIAELSDDDRDKDEFRLFLLKPDKYTDADSFNERECQLFEKLGIKLPSALIWTDIELSYDNWNASEILRAVIPGEFDSVSGFTQTGHIAHLNLREDVMDYKYLIGEVLLDKISTLKTVVNKTNVIDNTFRNFEMELLAGEKDFFATVRENKCTYQFDFDKVYWNSRLSSEHARLINKLSNGDFVFDVFAGVGPFAIPAAKKDCHVFANDLNPHSFKWLVHNQKLNKVTSHFETFNLDGREFIHSKLKPLLSTQWQELLETNGNGQTDFKFHIIMNLPALAVEFLDSFVLLFDNMTDILAKLDESHLLHIYCYCFYKGDNPDVDIKGNVLRILQQDTDDLKDFEIRFVRNVAPNKDMYCVEFLMPVSVMCEKQVTASSTANTPQSLGTEAKRRRIEEL